MMYRFRRGTTAQNDALIEKAGIITIDTEKEQLRIHDGVTKGGKVIPNLDDVARLERIIDNLSAGAPVFETLGLGYRLDKATHCPTTLKTAEAYGQGTTSIEYVEATNPDALVRTTNVVLRNLTDDDEVVILERDLKDDILTITPTNKPWSAGAELTTWSEADNPERKSIVIDVSNLAPQGVNITALIAQVRVNEYGQTTGDSSGFRLGPVGLMDSYLDNISIFPQVPEHWVESSVIVPVKNNRFAVGVYQDALEMSVRVQIRGYYAAI